MTAPSETEGVLPVPSDPVRTRSRLPVMGCTRPGLVDAQERGVWPVRDLDAEPAR